MRTRPGYGADSMADAETAPEAITQAELAQALEAYSALGMSPLGFAKAIFRDIRIIRMNAGKPDDEPESVTLPRYELELLLAVATTYVDAFAPDEMMTLPGKLLLQDVEAILERYGRRY